MGADIHAIVAGVNDFGALTAIATWNPGNLTAGSQQAVTVAVPGVVLGDGVMAVSFSLDLQETHLLGYVSAAGQVTVIHNNDTASDIDVGSGSLRVWVIPADF